jgi:signal transduction histidine kinase
MAKTKPTPSIADDDIESLRSRVRQLEVLEADYKRLRNLLDAASEGHNLDNYASNLSLYIDAETRIIIEESPVMASFLGVSYGSLRGRSIDDFERMDADQPSSVMRHVESSIEEVVYVCRYRHKHGYEMPVRVYRRQLTRETRDILHYRIEDLSVSQRVWREITRREDSGYQFREKLKTLNEVNVELGALESFDELCRMAVKLGVERLGFGRLSMWFYDSEHERMVGSYGIDEFGLLRDERQNHWSYRDTYIEDFILGRIQPVVTHEHAPIYNHRSEIIGYGWHISVPLLYQGQFMGFMTTDNYMTQQPIKGFQPELLRMYGATIGHLAAHQRDREATRRLDDLLRTQRAQVQMLETFITQVRHDFRTPLTVINTNAYLMQRAEDPTRRETLSQNIQTQVMHINDLIEDMMMVVNLEQRGEPWDSHPVELSALVNESVEAVASMMTDRGVTGLVSPMREVSVMGNAPWLRRALHEVIENAVVYNVPSGTVEVGLVVEKDHVCVRVRDSGVGIAPEVLPHIFSPMFRADSARTARASGLGLWIAKRVMELHGGSIRAESVVGQGTMVELRLPG